MSQAARGRVLFVAYTFPPIGGSGVQRTTKFVKYLPEYGWECSVLTVEGGSVPVWDTSLVNDIPPQTRVVKARTLEPSYAMKAAAGQPSKRRSIKSIIAKAGRSLLQPDAQVLWMPAACRAGLALLEQEPHDAIVATGPPFTCFLVGRYLAGRTGLPLVLDYRDEWSLSNVHYENRRPGVMASTVQRGLENWALRGARVVLATTQGSAKTVADAARRIGGSPEEICIYNGYDSQDFLAPPPARQSHKFRLVYTGTLWSLMSLRPLVSALEALQARDASLVAKLEVVLAGRRTPEQNDLVLRLQRLACSVAVHDYMNHDEAVALMMSADALCLLLERSTGAERWVPAKTFEYLATRRPILAVVPEGELRQLLVDSGRATIAPSGNDAAVEQMLRTTLSSFASGQWSPKPGTSPERFERRGQARVLAATLSDIAAPVADTGSAQVVGV